MGSEADDLGLRRICGCTGSGVARVLGLRGICDCVGSGILGMFVCPVRSAENFCAVSLA